MMVVTSKNTCNTAYSVQNTFVTTRPGYSNWFIENFYCTKLYIYCTYKHAVIILHVQQIIPLVHPLNMCTNTYNYVNL